MHVHVCVCMRACVCVSVGTSACVSVCARGRCVYTCMCVCMRACVCVSVGTCACVSACACGGVCAVVHVHGPLCAHTCMHVCMCACVCRCVLLSRIMRIPCSRVLSPCSAAPMLMRSVCLPESCPERKTSMTGHCEQSRLPSVGTSSRAGLRSAGTGRPTPGQLVPTAAKQVHKGCCGPVAWPRGPEPPGLSLTLLRPGGRWLLPLGGLRLCSGGSTLRAAPPSPAHWETGDGGGRICSWEE